MSMSFKASPDGTHGEILVNGQVVAKLPVTGNAVIPNLVGTVSQSGGIPTGAIIESGSNANGMYVRFADGTQICRWYITFGSTASGSSLSANRVFPAGFASNPLTSVSVGSGSYVEYVNASVASSSATEFSTWVRNSHPTETAQAINVHWTAIGRWY